MISSRCETSGCFDTNSGAPDNADGRYLLHFDRWNFQAEGLERVSGTADLWIKPN
jgi:hypothetical protein